MKGNKQIFYSTLLFTFVSFSLFMLAVVNHWFGPATDVGGQFCEAARDGLIKQPANTWSNIGFITAGLLMAFQLSNGNFSANKNPFTQSSFTAIFFSCLVVFLGPGSMAMHATETEIGGEFDMLSMYLVASFAASYAMQRYWKWSNTIFTVSFVLGIIVCEVAGLYHEHLPLIDYAGNLIFGIFLTISCIFELLNGYQRKISLNKKYGYTALGSLLLAFFIWNIWKDNSPLCDPYSYIQGHAIWHLLDAVAAYFLFRFYASEHTEV